MDERGGDTSRYLRLHDGGAYAGADSVDEALRWLEESFRRREGPAPFSALDPMFDSVRGDPRFVAIFERAGVTP
jgi:hypothetical protein